MSAAEWDGSALPFRVNTLERNEVRISGELSNHGETLATHSEQISALRATGERLSSTLDKVLWALIGLALTIAGSAVGVMLTIGGGGHG